MIASTQLHCKCIRCGGILRFPANRAGQIAACYHCGLETWLHVDARNEEQMLSQEKEEERSTGRRVPINHNVPAPSRVPIRLPPKPLRYVLLGLAAFVAAAYLVCLGLALSARH